MSEPVHIVTVIAILKYRNKYLLVQRNVADGIFPGKWQNLGGKVENGESIEEALRREIQEEIGINIPKNLHPIFIQSYSWVKKRNLPISLGLIFMFKLKKGPWKIKLSQELTAYGWFSFSEVKKLDSIAKDSRTGTLGQLRFVEQMKADV